MHIVPDAIKLRHWFDWRQRSFTRHSLKHLCPFCVQHVLECVDRVHELWALNLNERGGAICTVVRVHNHSRCQCQHCVCPKLLYNTPINGDINEPYGVSTLIRREIFGIRANSGDACTTHLHCMFASHSLFSNTNAQTPLRSHSPMAIEMGPCIQYQLCRLSSSQCRVPLVCMKCNAGYYLNWFHALHNIDIFLTTSLVLAHIVDKTLKKTISPQALIWMRKRSITPRDIRLSLRSAWQWQMKRRCWRLAIVSTEWKICTVPSAPSSVVTDLVMVRCM